MVEKHFEEVLIYGMPDSTRQPGIHSHGGFQNSDIGVTLMIIPTELEE